MANSCPTGKGSSRVFTIEAEKNWVSDFEFSPEKWSWFHLMIQGHGQYFEAVVFSPGSLLYP